MHWDIRFKLIVKFTEIYIHEITTFLHPPIRRLLRTDIVFIPNRESINKMI